MWLTPSHQQGNTARHAAPILIGQAGRISSQFISHTSELASAAEVPSATAAVHAAWTNWGIPIQLGKEVTKEHEIEVLGAQVVGTLGRISFPRAVANKLIVWSSWFCQEGHRTMVQAQIVGGRWVRAFQFRRELSSLLDFFGNGYTQKHCFFVTGFSQSLWSMTSHWLICLCLCVWPICAPRSARLWWLPMLRSGDQEYHEHLHELRKGKLRCKSCSRPKSSGSVGFSGALLRVGELAASNGTLRRNRRNSYRSGKGRPSPACLPCRLARRAIDRPCRGLLEWHAPANRWKSTSCANVVMGASIPSHSLAAYSEILGWSARYKSSSLMLKSLSWRSVFRTLTWIFEIAFRVFWTSSPLKCVFSWRVPSGVPVGIGDRGNCQLWVIILLST